MQAFFDLTDLDGVIEKYPLKCGKQKYALTMRGSDDPVPSFITIVTSQIMISPRQESELGTYELDLKYSISTISFRQSF